MLWKLGIYYTWKNINKLYKNNEFKISGTTWGLKSLNCLVLFHRSYSISRIQNNFEYILNNMKNWKTHHQPKYITAWKVSKIGRFPGPYFPVFGLNTEIYSLNLRIQPEYRKKNSRKTRKNSVFGHFFTQFLSVKFRTELHSRLNLDTTSNYWHPALQNFLEAQNKQ